MRSRVLLFLVLAVGMLLFASSRWPNFIVTSEPDRCFEAVDLAQLIRSEGLARPAQSWGAGTTAVTSENLLDEEQEATLSLEDPVAGMRRLCDRLKSELPRRCEVKASWTGADYCAVMLESPGAPSAHGALAKTRVRGRLALYASRAAEGKTTLVMTGTEWPL